APFTPIVASDINGDGAKNDRAFIFDPGLTADPAVRAGMQALLDGAPASVRRCLRTQLGRIAARNSCTGPWQPSLDLQLNWRPDWFGLDRRLTVSLLTVNLLGGLDEWLHGAANLRGWGYAAAPDPVLLHVRGFDPTTAQFHYAVNGRFGATASASGGVTVPFQIALQGRLAIGPGSTRATACSRRHSMPARSSPRRGTTRAGRSSAPARCSPSHNGASSPTRSNRAKRRCPTSPRHHSQHRQPKSAALGRSLPPVHRCASVRLVFAPPISSSPQPVHSQWPAEIELDQTERIDRDGSVGGEPVEMRAGYPPRRPHVADQLAAGDGVSGSDG